jgi:cobalt-zinc-cadmium efflux system membrane fusion protein
VKSLLSLLTLAAMTLACGRHGGPEPAQPPANEVWLTPEQNRQTAFTVEPVGPKAVGGLVQTVGRLTFDDRLVSHVFSPVNGRVTRLLADPGQRVKSGQTLALIDSPDLGQALSDLRKAEAALKPAEREFTRQKELYEAHAGALRDLEAAEAAFRTAQAERDRCRERVESLHAPGEPGVSQGFRLQSPLAGEVISRTANPGVEVQGQYGGGTALELFTVGEIDRLWLLADLYEVDLFRVKVGSPVEITLQGYAGGPVHAKVEWISDALDPATRTAKMRCTLPNPGRVLKPEMFAQVAIHVEPRTALAVPRSAVCRIGSQTFAFVDLGLRADGVRRFERRPVTVEEAVPGDDLPVQSGLSAGERVVSRGVMVLSGQN